MDFYIWLEIYTTSFQVPRRILARPRNFLYCHTTRIVFLVQIFKIASVLSFLSLDLYTILFAFNIIVFVEMNTDNCECKSRASTNSYSQLFSNQRTVKEYQRKRSNETVTQKPPLRKPNHFEWVKGREEYRLPHRQRCRRKCSHSYECTFYCGDLPESRIFVPYVSLRK